MSKKELLKQELPLVKLYSDDEFDQVLKDVERRSIDPKLVKKQKQQ